MKTRITAVLVAASILVAAFAAVAAAATSQTITGTMTTVSYNAAKKTGKLHVRSSSGTKTTIALNAKTDCGVSHGQSGDQIPCKTIVKYQGRQVRVIATRYADGHRVATIVGVDLTK
jgi:Ni/Co efflux regulator RcnB